MLGIIPARAGFTRAPSVLSTNFRDHPRACGVYARHRHPSRCARGSSPRVRGLRDPQPHLLPPGGIIPARAGFTRISRPRCIIVQDHPRACGVYGRMTERQLSGHWIIPARAGFTPPNKLYIESITDHPRACGVYATARRLITSGVGSSPRVRGLLLKNAFLGSEGRIIPARAGFTIMRVFSSSR